MRPTAARDRNATSFPTALVSVTAVFLLVTTGTARAEPPARSWSLSWTRASGAETCVGAKALAEAVEALLGKRVFVSAALADLSVEGGIEPSASGWRAVMRVTDRDGSIIGSREIER